MSDVSSEGAPRFARHVIDLDDGHRVGIAVAGRGVPVVVIHGFGAEGRIYAQTLARVAALGLRVIALDAPGHGDTDPAPGDEPTLGDAASVIVRALDQLGVRRAVLAGHSMGGRLAVEVAARAPERTLTVVIVDAIVGAPWDRIQRDTSESRLARARFAREFWIDTLSTVPWTDWRQSLKLGWRSARAVSGHVIRPWESLRSARVVTRSASSVATLERIAAAGVPLIAIHGDADPIVPLSAAKDAATRTAGELVVVRGAGHSWLIRCPDTLPAIVEELLEGGLGDALASRGLPRGAAPAALEAACCAPGAPLANYGRPHRARSVSGVPRYEWRLDRAA